MARHKQSSSITKREADICFQIISGSQIPAAHALEIGNLLEKLKGIVNENSDESDPAGNTP